eukprot:g2219.t1
MWDDYVWILVLTSLLAFFTSFGIGANDVANAFATSVGAKSVTLPQAIIIAGIFEFAGALLLGANVTSTISKGLVDVKDFENTPELLMYGMMCVVASTGLWLLLACYLELPVSTTHSTIGGIIGFAVVAHGWSTVKWYEYNDNKSGLDKYEGIVPIIISWVTSPLLAGLISVTLFLLVRSFILRKEDSLERSLKFFPLLVGIACVVNIYYICLVGFDKKKVDYKGKKKSISDILGFGWASLIAWVLTIIIVVIVHFAFIPWLRKQTKLATQGLAPHISMPSVSSNRQEEHLSPLDGSQEDHLVEEEIAPSENLALIEDDEGKETRDPSWLNKVSELVDVDVHGVIESDQTVHEIHSKSESFDPATEHSFSYLQVFTATCVSFAHGANDVANSIGPLAAVFAVYKHSRVDKDSHVPEWILLLGGSGIVLGLAVYGHTIIRAIGVKLVKVSPARGFAMEFATATVISFGSIYGIPLSTTHCQVGSTTAVGMVEGTRGVNKTLLFKVFGGWIVTIAIVASTTALFFAQGVYAPSKLNLEAIQNYKNGVNRAIELAGAMDQETTASAVDQAVSHFEQEKQDVSVSQIEFLEEILLRIST